MLTAIRDRVSGWIAYFIVLLISIPFALWGIDQYFGGGSDNLVAAEVNGVEIPLQAFTYQYQQQRRYMQQVYGADFPANQNDAAIKQLVLQSMVRQQLLEQEADQADYKVSDQVLLSEITRLDAFKTNGQFDERRYEQLLRTQGQTKADFENSLRRQIGVSYFEDGIQKTAFLPPSARQSLLRLENQQRKFAYFVIPADPAKVNIGDAAISRYYESHRDGFKTPERVKLAYVELSEKGLMHKIQPSEAALRKYYQDEVDRYTTPEQRKARQILIKVPEGADQAVLDKARRRAEKLAARLQAGADFAALAKKYSEDELSASSGGDLGFIARGDLNPDVEDALFSLQKGEVSDPVNTALGFQIIQLVGIKPAKQEPFTEARAEVARDYRQQEAQDRFLQQAEQLETLSYEQSASLEPAAKALELEVRQTDWVSRQQGLGVFANRKVRRAAFNADVLQGGHNSDMVELRPSRIVVLRVVQHEAAKPKPLAQVRDDVTQVLSVSAAESQAAQAGQQALQALRSGKTIDEVAEKRREPVKTPGFVGRTDAQLPQPIISEAFALNKPLSQEDATFGGAQLDDGGYAVIALREVRAGQAQANEASAAATTSAPAANYGLRERDAAYQALEAASEVKVSRDSL